MVCAATRFSPILNGNSMGTEVPIAPPSMTIMRSPVTVEKKRICSNRSGHGTRCKRIAVDGRKRCAKCMASARRTRVVHWEVTMVNQSKTADRRRKMEWESEEYITADWLRYLYKNQPDCYWCGASYLCTKNRRHNRGRTIERLDNKLPHLKRNCVYACAWCNRRSWQPGWEIDPFHLRKYRYCIDEKLSREVKIIHDRLMLELKSYSMRKYSRKK